MNNILLSMYYYNFLLFTEYIREKIKQEFQIQNILNTL